MLAIRSVTKRFGRRLALDDVSLTIDRGQRALLVGPNGAGKTTLLRIAAGLLRPDRGGLTGPALPDIGYAGQHVPLYGALTVAQTLRLGARLNPCWDATYAQRLADAADLPPRARVAALAPGRRARLALIMALGKRPGLLLLDEPLAALDPVARTEALGTLMADVAERGTTVVLSSHVVADVDGVCDHLLLLASGRVRLAAGVHPALDGHLVAVGAAADRAALDDARVVDIRQDGDGFTALVAAVAPTPSPRLSWHRPTLDELVLGYLRASTPRPVPAVTAQ